MDLQKATEQAYKNGYEKGKKETAENIFKQAIKKVKERFTQTKGYTSCYDVVFTLEELAKQQGVEIKE